MKRYILFRHLRKNGCFMKKENDHHFLWCNSANGHIEAIPKLPEINDRIAKKVCIYMAIPNIKKIKKS